MIHLNNVKYMAGGDVTVCPALPYNDTAVEFLDCLSKSLMKYREYPDTGFAGKRWRLSECRH